MGKDFVKIKYSGKEFILVDKVEYKGKNYFYIVENVYDKEKNIDLENLKEDLNVEINFIYKLPDGKYQNVDGKDKLFDKLLRLVNMNYIMGKNQYVSLDDDV